MNRQQKDQVMALLEVFDSEVFKSNVAEKYKDSGDYSGVLIGELSLDSYILLVCKIYAHFKQEITEENFATLPLNYNLSDVGSGNLINDIGYLNNYNGSGDFPNALGYALRLAAYQRIYGFWEYNSRRVLSASTKKIQSDNELMEAKKILIDSRISDLDELIRNISNEHERLESFNEESITKIKTLEASLQNIMQQSETINNLYNNATNSVEKVNTQLTLAESKKNDLDKLFDKAASEIDKINVDISDYKSEYAKVSKKLELLTEDFDKKLTFVEEKQSYFIERNSYLDDLIGREVGASLFETFKQRKNELSPSVKFWRWTVPCLAVATVVWIWLLFHWSSDEAMSYQLLIINSIKALPAIGLLLFGIAQYSKERNFQEEYAFKSAVALTLNAYAEQLLSDENKDALILSSVSSIYKSPIHHSKLKVEDGKGAIDSVSELLGKFKEINFTKK